jgi:nucleoside-diphosphate-sugar epimerase
MAILADKKILFVGHGAIISHYLNVRNLQNHQVVSDSHHRADDKTFITYKELELLNLRHFDTIIIATRLEKLNLDSQKKLTEIFRFLSQNSAGKRFILLSSVAVYGDCTHFCNEGSAKMGKSPYALSKISLERDFASHFSGANHSILRISNIFGAPDQQDVINIFLKGISLENQIRVSREDNFRDFLHVDDFYKVLDFLIMTESDLPHLLNVAFGESISIHGLVNEIIRHPALEGLNLVTEMNFESSHIHSFIDVALLRSLIPSLKQSSKTFVTDYVKNLILMNSGNQIGGQN